MNKNFINSLILWTMTVSLLAGCTNASTPSAAAEEANPVEEKLILYTPASTSSIPVIIAAGKMDNVDLELYTNQSQANTLFLRGDVSILVSGLSVGVDLYKNGAPVQVMNSFVTGLSYLVTYGKQVNDLSELNGEQVYFPFEGSPIEEVTTFLVKQQGTDLLPVYLPFESSIELLKQGSARAVILPEPNVTLVEGQPNVYISLSLFDLWNQQTHTDAGYPQVASFVNPDWAKEHAEEINQFNQALSEAIVFVQQNPEEAVKEVQEYYKLPAEKLLTSVNRTQYNLSSGSEMQMVIEDYYQTIGKPLDENLSDFYFISAQ